MKRKSVLVVENRPALRGILKGGLEKRGFSVASAANEEKARERSENLGSDLDVVLLDVELDAGENGLHFGMWLKEEWERQGRWLPEFLVFSAHEKPDYYQTAIQLGAAAYLLKGELGGDPGDPIPDPNKPVRIDRIAHHVRALALRRALRSDRPNGAQDIREVARKSRSLETALERFCRDLLKPELEATLGGHFIMLFASEPRGIVCFAGSRIEVDSSELFERIQKAVHGRLGEVEPMVLDAGDGSWMRDFPSGEHVSAGRTLNRLHGAAFIPLGAARGGSLTLGLVPDACDTEISTAELARILGQYLTRAIAVHWVELTGIWAAIDKERRDQLKATSNFCLYQGQELEVLLQEAEEEGKERDRKVPPLRKLHAVAQELRSAGEMLAQVEFLADREKPDAGCQRIAMEELLPHRWSSGLSGHLHLPDTTLRVEGRCLAEVPKAEVERSVSQVLFWLGRRLKRLPRREETPQAICCYLDQKGDQARIRFDEHTSRRMPKRMRDLLFAPFNSLPLQEPGELIADETLKGHRLGLYLAKVLAETVGGSLEEDSDAIPGDFGHRFILELPAAH